MLAACWFNRGDALMQLATPTKSRAIHSTTRASRSCAASRSIRIRDTPAIRGCRTRLAQLAHGEDAGGVASAVNSFDEALNVLESDAASALADRDYLVAGVWANIAIARAAAKTREADVLARAAALRAIGLAANLERDDMPSAEVGLKARYVLCQVIAGQLPAQSTAGANMPDEVHEATDHAEAGLALAKQWEAKGELRFWPLAHDLYRFAEVVYERYQPQFLAEFLHEHEGFK